MKLSKDLLNFIFFQGCWWILILLARSDFEFRVELTFLAAGITLALHFLLVTSKPGREALFLIFSFCLGIFVETFLINVHAYHYDLVPRLDFRLPPYWIFALWLCFPTTLGHSLAWLKKWGLMGMFIGALGTTGTYYVGQRMDLIFFTEPYYRSLTFFCGFWIILLAALYSAREKIMGSEH